MVGGGDRVRILTATAVVALVLGWFVYTNLAPFFGLDYSGALSMYSGLAVDTHDHLLLARRPQGGPFGYYTVERLKLSGERTRPRRELERFVDWASERKHRLNLNYLRYQFQRVCRAGPGSALAVRLVAEDGQVVSADDACQRPDLLWFSPFSSYRACKPDCNYALLRWARRGRPPGSSG